MIRWITHFLSIAGFVAVVSGHDFLCRKWLYGPLALHGFSLIMLNETYSFDLITVAL
jgi:hypothetical protein